MIRTQIYLPKSQIKELKKQARTRELTVSEILRGIIDEKLRPDTHGLSHTSLVKTAKRIAAMKPEGPSDLATNLDEHLYGAV